MNIVIDRHSGGVACSTDSGPGEGYVSGRMRGFGRVSRLHGEDGATWFPGWQKVEEMLAGCPPGEIYRRMTQIEGEFLILYQAGGKVYIFCDRFALFRVFYRLTPASLELFDAILGEVSHLSASPAETLSFVMFRYVIGRRTLFDGICRLMPGECLVLDAQTGELNIETTCVFPKIELERMSELATGQTMHRLFQEALDAHLQTVPADEKLLLPLSGGYDSTYLLATALEMVSPHRIITMTYGEPGTYDYEIGRKVAQALGVRNLAIPLSPKNYGDEALIRNGEDMNGEASFTTETPQEVFTYLAEHGRYLLSGHPGGAPLGQKCEPDTRPDARSIVAQDFLFRPGDPLGERLDPGLIDESFYFMNSGMESALYLPEHWFLINHLTRYSNACVLKLRKHFQTISPSADYALNDFVTNLPVEQRFNLRMYVRWIQYHFPRLAELPSRDAHGAPLGSGTLRRFAAKQWDRFLLHGLKINKRAVKIDWNRWQGQLLDKPRLYQLAGEIFGPEIREEIFNAGRSCIVVLYTLKSLDLLREAWGVEFRGAGEKELAPVRLPEREGLSAGA